MSVVQSIQPGGPGIRTHGTAHSEGSRTLSSVSGESTSHLRIGRIGRVGDKTVSKDSILEIASILIS